MKTLKCLLVFIAFVALSLVGCRNNSQSPVEPAVQGSTVSLDKKGPVVHSVEGSGLLTYNGNNLGGRYAALEYADGTFDGDFEINNANATEDHSFKLNGEVVSFNVYDNVGQYGGKMAVFLGKEKTGINAGYYCVFFVIDNGNPGQSSDPDQVNGILVELPTLDFQIPAEWGSPWTGMTILDFYNMSPNDLMNNMFVADCDKGNITVN